MNMFMIMNAQSFLGLVRRKKGNWTLDYLSHVLGRKHKHVLLKVSAVGKRNWALENHVSGPKHKQVHRKEKSSLGLYL